MVTVNTTGSELIHFPLFFLVIFFLLHTPPINLEIEEVGSWIKGLLNQEQVRNPNRQLAVAAPGIFFRVFLNKHKLHNLIKRKFCILTTTIIKKHANT